MFPQKAAIDLVSGMLRDAVAMADTGFATPTDIDTAMRLGAAHPVGPLAFLRTLDAETVRQLGFASLPTESVADSDVDRLESARRWDHPVGVLGAGTMAAGITEALIRAGVDTVAVSRSTASTERLRAAVTTSVDSAVTKGRLAAATRDEALARLRLTTDANELRRCGHVIEAVAEQREIKRELLANLDALLPEDVVFATNTSSLTVQEIGAELPLGRRVVALHFFNPAKTMKLVEVVGTDSSDVQAACDWVRRVNKVPVRCRDERGFVVNRLLIPYLNDAVRALDHAAFTSTEADALIREVLGHPMGPFELIDLIGADVTLAAQTLLFEASGEARLEPADGLRRMTTEGRLGRKTGRGFHEYPTAVRSTT